MATELPFTCKHGLHYHLTTEESEVLMESEQPVGFYMSFTLQHNHVLKMRRENGTTYTEDQIDDPAVVKEFKVNPDDLSCRLISDMLCNLQVSHDYQVKILPDLFSFAHNVINSVFEINSRKKMSMSVQLFFIHEYLYDEREVENYIIRESMEEYEQQGYELKSASTSSIEALEKVILDDGHSKENCIVCLEELQVGSLVTEMPCSHVFHGSCIVSWLEKRNLCPLCRFVLN